MVPRMTRQRKSILANANQPLTWFTRSEKDLILISVLSNASITFSMIISFINANKKAARETSSGGLADMGERTAVLISFSPTALRPTVSRGLL